MLGRFWDGEGGAGVVLKGVCGALGDIGGVGLFCGMLGEL